MKEDAITGPGGGRFELSCRETVVGLYTENKSLISESECPPLGNGDTIPRVVVRLKPVGADAPLK